MPWRRRGHSFKMDKTNQLNFLKNNKHFRFASLSEEQRHMLVEADSKGKVEALVNNKWYLKTNLCFADDGIYRISNGYH